MRFRGTSDAHVIALDANRGTVKKSTDTMVAT
jgi:hypothetical protein